MIYSLLKTLHILSAAVLFGTGMGIAYFQFRAWRSQNVAVFSAVARQTITADWLFAASAVVLQPLSGLALLHLSGIPWNAPWLVAAYVLYGVTGIFWLPVVAIQIKVARLAEEALASGEAMPQEAQRLMRIWFLSGWPAFIAVIATYWLMVAKPV